MMLDLCKRGKYGGCGAFVLEGEKWGKAINNKSSTIETRRLAKCSLPKHAEEGGIGQYTGES